MSLDHKPLVGPHQPTTQIGLCGCAERPGAPACLAPATWHGLVVTPDHTELRATMVACAEHRRHMAASADYIHPLDSPCGIGRSWWTHDTGESGCETDLDHAWAAAAVDAAAAFLEAAQAA